MAYRHHLLKKNFFVCLGLLSLLLTQPAMANDWNCSTNVPGDANADGDVNVLDVIVMANMILGPTLFVDASDVNCDGSVNVQDIILVVDVVLGESTFADEECTAVCTPELDCSAVEKLVVYEANGSLGPCGPTDTRTITPNGSIIWETQMETDFIQGTTDCPEGNTYTSYVAPEEARALMDDICAIYSNSLHPDMPMAGSSVTLWQFYNDDDEELANSRLIHGSPGDSGTQATEAINVFWADIASFNACEHLQCGDACDPYFGYPEPTPSVMHYCNALNECSTEASPTCPTCEELVTDETVSACVRSYGTWNWDTCACDASDDVSIRCTNQMCGAQCDSWTDACPNLTTAETCATESSCAWYPDASSGGECLSWGQFCAAVDDETVCNAATNCEWSQEGQCFTTLTETTVLRFCQSDGSCSPTSDGICPCVNAFDCVVQNLDAYPNGKEDRAQDWCGPGESLENGRCWGIRGHGHFSCEEDATLGAKVCTSNVDTTSDGTCVGETCCGNGICEFLGDGGETPLSCPSDCGQLNSGYEHTGCGAQFAWMSGQCAMLNTMWRWNGETCEPLGSGCACNGPDCDLVYPSDVGDLSQSTACTNAHPSPPDTYDGSTDMGFCCEVDTQTEAFLACEHNWNWGQACECQLDCNAVDQITFSHGGTTTDCGPLTIETLHANGNVTRTFHEAGAEPCTDPQTSSGTVDASAAQALVLSLCEARNQTFIPANSCSTWAGSSAAWEFYQDTDLLSETGEVACLLSNTGDYQATNHLSDEGRPEFEALLETATWE